MRPQRRHDDINSVNAVIRANPKYRASIKPGTKIITCTGSARVPFHRFCSRGRRIGPATLPSCIVTFLAIFLLIPRPSFLPRRISRRSSSLSVAPASSPPPSISLFSSSFRPACVRGPTKEILCDHLHGSYAEQGGEGWLPGPH